MSEAYEVKVRPEKVEAVQQIRDSLERSAVVLLTEYRGLTVGQIAELRRALAATRSEYRVVKNTLTLRALSELGVDGLREVLEGPTAVAYCYGDPVEAAKAMATFARANPALVIKGGVLDGRPLNADDAKGLATVDPLEMSLAKICGALTAPLGAIAGTLEAPLSQLVYVLEQVAARGQQGE